MCFRQSYTGSNDPSKETHPLLLVQTMCGSTQMNINQIHLAIIGPKHTRTHAQAGITNTHQQSTHA